MMKLKIDKPFNENMMIKKIMTTLLLLFFAFEMQAQCWKDFSAGGGHIVALKNDGSLWTWGWNSKGQLGTGDTNDDTITPTHIGTDTDWKSVFTGSYFSMAFKNDNTVWAWGHNAYGQLGNGTTTDVLIPTKVNIGTDWKIISTEGASVMAIKNDGSLWGWGNNVSGQLGDGTNIQRNIPTQIGTSNDWKNVVIGAHTIAIKNDGSLWTWGKNNFGQLGDGTSTSRNTPLRIGNANDWNSIAVGENHTLAIKNNGSLWTWGANFNGQLGNSVDYSHSYIPVRIGTGFDWKKVEGGYDYSLAIKNNGTLWSWGSDLYGQLGTNSVLSGTNRPTQINNSVDWNRIFTNDQTSFALKNDSSLWGWGVNHFGTLADGTTTNRHTPIQISCSSLSVSDSNSKSLQIYPNPAKDYFSINAKDIKQVQLYSLDGKLIKEYTPSDKYNIHDVTKGIYIIKITDSKEVSSTYKLKIID